MTKKKTSTVKWAKNTLLCREKKPCEAGPATSNLDLRNVRARAFLISNVMSEGAMDECDGFVCKIQNIKKNMVTTGLIFSVDAEG